MNSTALISLRLFGVASILAIAASAAVAQTGPESQPKTPAAAAPDAGNKPEKAAKRKPAAPSGYASETEARAHCKGGVVWVDGHDHFTHYPGSREYGKKPGEFICDKG